MGRPFKTLTLTASAVMLSSAVYAEDIPFRPQYPFETAIVEYEGTGALGGTSRLMIDATAHMQATKEHTETNIMGMVQKKNSLRIVRPDGIYTIDLDKKTGFRSDNPQIVLEREWQTFTAIEKQNVRENAEKFGFNLAASMGGSITPKGGNVLGKSCDLAKVMGTVTCTWSGLDIVLSTEMNMGIPGSQKAVSINEDVPLPKGIFEIPKGINVLESPAGDMTVTAARNMLHAMKNPDFNGNLNNLMPASGAPSNLSIPKKMQNPAHQDKLQEMMQNAGKLMQQMGTNR